MVIDKSSLAVINGSAPYKVKYANGGEALSFITDYDVEIFVTFEKDD